MSVPRMADLLADLVEIPAAGSDCLVGLSVLRALEDELRDEMGVWVRRAREEGWSWESIGEAVGLHQTSAMARWRRAR